MKSFFLQFLHPKSIAIMQLMRWHKPIGIYLCLCPTLWALWLASDGRPRVALIFLMIIGSIIVRSAGCVINDIWDRDIDPHVERTRLRPLASGRLTVQEACIVFGVLALLALAMLLLLNPLSRLIAITAGLLTLVYPLAKRVTRFPQVILSMPFNAGVLIAYAMTQQTLPAMAWILYATAMVWTLIYDTWYAMADKCDDVLIGVKSTAIFFNAYDKMAIGLLQIIMLILLISVGTSIHFHF